MADEFDNNDDDGAAPESNEDFRNLRNKAKKADRLEPENQRLTRENAFLRAGIQVDDPRMAYFVKGYEGELEKDQIVKAAIEAGFLAPPPPPPVDPAVQQAEAGQAAVMAAAAGAESGLNEHAAQYEMDQAYAQGGLEGLSAVTQRYGVTFNPPEV